MASTHPLSPQQTVWLGCQNGDIFLHRSMTERHRATQTTRLPCGIADIRYSSPNRLILYPTYLKRVEMLYLFTVRLDCRNCSFARSCLVYRSLDDHKGSLGLGLLDCFVFSDQ